MKNSPFEELIRDAGQEIKLSASERAHILSVLHEHVASHPVEEAAPRFAAYRTMVAAMLAYTRRPAFAFAAVALVIIVSSGTLTYAAQGSLPGDPLYAVKVDVTEPLETALTFSSVKKIAWQQTLAERRLDEAIALATDGKLATTTEATLASDFIRHASAVAIVSATSSDSTNLTLTPAHFAAQLSAYQNVLTAQAELDHGRSATGVLQGAVRAQIALLASTTPEDNPSPAHLQSAARVSLDDSARLLGSVTGTLSTSSSRSARGAFDRAQALTTRGNDLLEQNDTEGASRAFQDSLKATARLDVLAHAAAALHIDAFDSNATSTPATSTPPTSSSGSKRDDKKHDDSAASTTPATIATTSVSASASSVTTTAVPTPDMPASDPASQIKF